MLKLKNAPENACASRRKEPLRDKAQLMIRNVPEKCQQMKAPVVQVVRGIAMPTTEWRVVPDGVACPRGCEYKMDLGAGVNMIRKLQPAASTDRAARGALVVAPRQNPEPPKSLLKRKRLEVGDQQPATRRSSPILVSEDSPSPRRAGSAPQNRGSPSSRTLATGKYKAVEREHRRKKVSVRKDGSREEASVAVKSREIRPKNGGSNGSKQKTTSKQEQGIRRLRDGRKVITETITLQRVTVLPKSPSKKCPRSPMGRSPKKRG